MKTKIILAVAAAAVIVGIGAASCGL